MAKDYVVRESIVPMVYARAGVVIAAFGIVMVAVPKLVIRFQQWSYPHDELDASEWRIRVVRYAGIVFLAIGIVFFVGAQQGLL